MNFCSILPHCQVRQYFNVSNEESQRELIVHNSLMQRCPSTLHIRHVNIRLAMNQELHGRQVFRLCSMMFRRVTCRYFIDQYYMGVKYM